MYKVLAPRRTRVVPSLALHCSPKLSKRGRPRAIRLDAADEV
jgi:hypothetical protein